MLIAFVASGVVIGTAPRERSVPPIGARVVLEHPLYGPMAYRVVDAEYWYRSRPSQPPATDRRHRARPDRYTPTPAGRHLHGYPASDQYTATLVRLLVEPTGPS